METETSPRVIGSPMGLELGDHSIQEKLSLVTDSMSATKDLTSGRASNVYSIGG